MFNSNTNTNASTATTTTFLLRWLSIYYVCMVLGCSSFVVSWSTSIVQLSTMTPKSRVALSKKQSSSSSSSSRRYNNSFDTTAVALSSHSSSSSNNNDNDGSQSIGSDEVVPSASSSSSSGLERRSVVLGSIATATASVTTLLSPFMVLSSSPESVQAIQGGSKTRIPSWTLRGNVQFPRLALNTVGLSTEDTVRALESATKYGITHIDFHPGKERDGVAQFLQQPNSVRSKLFLNTKIRKAPPGTTPSDAAKLAQTQIKEDLAVLNVETVDMLMLRDSPDPAVIQSQWSVLEEALTKKQTRSIGVINFCEQALQTVLATATIPPAINYYLLHPGMTPDPKGLRSYGETRGIRTFAYGAMGEPGPNPELVSSSILQEIATQHQVSPEEVAVRWVVQTDAAISVRPTLDYGLGMSLCGPGTTKCDDGLKARSSIFTWKLTNNEMQRLNSMTSPNDNPTLFSSSGCPDAFVLKK